MHTPFKFIQTTLHSKKFILVAGMIILAAIFIYIFYSWPRPRVCFEKTCFKVELARTETKQKTGLMYREPLKPDQGMLFIFPTSEQHPFWMKNMRQNIDIVFLDDDKRVNFIAADQHPCATGQYCPLVTSPEDTRFVLELPAGAATRLNLPIGGQWMWDIIND